MVIKSLCSMIAVRLIFIDSMCAKCQAKITNGFYRSVSSLAEKCPTAELAAGGYILVNSLTESSAAFKPHMFHQSR